MSRNKINTSTILVKTSIFVGALSSFVTKDRFEQFLQQSLLSDYNSEFSSQATLQIDHLEFNYKLPGKNGQQSPNSNKKITIVNHSVICCKVQFTLVINNISATNSCHEKVQTIVGHAEQYIVGYLSKCRFMGRLLGASKFREAVLENTLREKLIPIHFSFVCNETTRRIDEEALYDTLQAFMPHVNFVDISLKRYKKEAVKNPSNSGNMEEQSGYGFIFVSSFKEEIECISRLKKTTVQSIHFECARSERGHYLFDQSSRNQESGNTNQTSTTNHNHNLSNNPNNRNPHNQQQQLQQQNEENTQLSPISSASADQQWSPPAGVTSPVHALHNSQMCQCPQCIAHPLSVYPCFYPPNTQTPPTIRPVYYYPISTTSSTEPMMLMNYHYLPPPPTIPPPMPHHLSSHTPHSIHPSIPPPILPPTQHVHPPIPPTPSGYMSPFGYYTPIHQHTNHNNSQMIARSNSGNSYGSHQNNSNSNSNSNSNVNNHGSLSHPVARCSSFDSANSYPNLSNDSPPSFSASSSFTYPPTYFR